MDDSLWSADQVEYWLLDAAQTLRAMKLSGRDFPSQRATYWPEVVHSSVEAYGWESAGMRRPAPAADKIDKMDAAISWLLLLTGDERRVVWARCSAGYKRMPWRYMEDIDGRSGKTLKGIYDGALNRIVAHLNAPAIEAGIQRYFSGGTLAGTAA